MTDFPESVFTIPTELELSWRFGFRGFLDTHQKSNNDTVWSIIRSDIPHLLVELSQLKNRIENQ